MDILNDKNSIDYISKPEMENIEREKEHYYLLGSFIVTKGLRLFGYNYLKDEIFEVDVQTKTTIQLVPIDNKLIPMDFESDRATVDSRFEYFQALNLKTANNRVEKYKQGKIKLNNLRKYNPNSIKLF